MRSIAALLEAAAHAKTLTGVGFRLSHPNLFAAVSNAVRRRSFFKFFTRNSGGRFHNLRIDWIARQLTGQHADNFLRRLGLQFDQRLYRVEAHVRRQDYVVATKKG